MIIIWAVLALAIGICNFRMHKKIMRTNLEDITEKLWAIYILNCWATGISILVLVCEIIK